MKTNHSKLNPAHFIIICFSCFAMCFFAACVQDDDEPSLEGDNYGIDDLAGTWLATEAFFSSLETPHKGSLDVIDENGSLTFKVESNGRFTVTIVLPGEPNMTFTGQLGFDEEWLAMAYDDEPDEYYYHFFELNDDKSIMTIRGEAYIDLDDDGVEDFVSMNMTFSKQ